MRSGYFSGPLSPAAAAGVVSDESAAAMHARAMRFLGILVLAVFFSGGNAAPAPLLRRSPFDPPRAQAAAAAAVPFDYVGFIETTEEREPAARAAR